MYPTTTQHTPIYTQQCLKQHAASSTGKPNHCYLLLPAGRHCHPLGGSLGISLRQTQVRCPRHAWQIAREKHGTIIQHQGYTQQNKHCSHHLIYYYPLYHFMQNVLFIHSRSRFPVLITITYFPYLYLKYSIHMRKHPVDY